MPNQSGKIILLLVLILLILGASAYFVVPSFRKQKDIKFNKTVDSENYPATKAENKKSLNQKNEEPQKIKTLELTSAGIKLDYPWNMSEETLSTPQDLGSVKDIIAEQAHKLYLNFNPKVDESGKMYSGLTMFIAIYPNSSDHQLDYFAPKITKDETNETNTIEKVIIGQFKGLKHIHCCNSGGGTDYYFLTSKSKKLIVIKVYNYGQEKDSYDKVVSWIMGSLRGSSK